MRSQGASGETENKMKGPYVKPVILTYRVQVSGSLREKLFINLLSIGILAEFLENY